MSIEVLVTNRDAIRRKFNKTAKDFNTDLETIKNWLKTQRHLPEIPNDNVIEFFLTRCKYSIEKTKQNIDTYYTIRDLLPEIFREVHPISSTHLTKIRNTLFCTLLPKLTQPELYRIAFAKYKESNPEDTDICKTLAHLATNFAEIRLHEDLCMGDVYVIDMQHLQFGVINKLTPTLMKQYATVLQKVHNNRMKQLHILFPPPFIDVMLSMFKSIVSKKLQDRIYIHQNLEGLFEYIPQEWLPSDYGGKEKSLKEFEEMWDKKFLEYKNHFDKLENMRVNESLRPEKLKNDDFLGFHGNFKKLDVD